MAIEPTSRPVTKALVLLALDAAALRHQAIAHNLANVHSAGHAPLKVNFEAQLQHLRQQAAAGRPLAADALAGIGAFIEPDPTPLAGSAASMIDQQMVQLAQNALHYQALLRALDKQGAILRVALNEGR